MKIFLGADHRGFELKEKIKGWLSGNKEYEVLDCGNTVFDQNDDYTDYAFSVADNVIRHPDNRGIMFCAAGTGMMIASNKVAGVRCGSAFTTAEVMFSRRHANTNCISISSEYSTEAEAREIISAFLSTPFEAEERFLRRIKKMEEKEK